MADPWFHSEAPWWAKRYHADEHLARLRDACDAYRRANPLVVRPEPTEQPGETAYRLDHEHKPIPVRISLLVGDLLHSLRSALDNLAFRLVEYDLGRVLSEDEQRACQFPIYADPNSFDDFFHKHRTRREIMQEPVRRALRAVQPFYWLEHGLRVDPASVGERNWEDEARYHPLTTINRLSNIDKHRRLAVTAWWPASIWFSVTEGTGRTWRPGRGFPWKHGDIVGYISGTGPEPSQVVHEFNLVLTDAPSHRRNDLARSDLPQEAAGWIAEVHRDLHLVINEYLRITA